MIVKHASVEVGPSNCSLVGRLTARYAVDLVSSPSNVKFKFVRVRSLLYTTLKTWTAICITSIIMLIQKHQK